MPMPDAEGAEQSCMYCGGTRGHGERVQTDSAESLDGWEDWFCCHDCRDAGKPCETFHAIPIARATHTDTGEG